MKRFLAIAALALMPAAAMAQAAPAETASASTSFLVLDTDRVAAEATAMRAIYDQIERQKTIEAAAYNMALDKLEGEFDPIRAQSATMDAAEYEKAVTRFNEIKAEIDGVLKQAQDRLMAAGEKAIAQFNASATEIGQQLLKEHGASRFLDGAAVLYVREGSGYDVTSEAIKRINARLPTVKLELPAPPKTAAPKS
jgi:Skp family chaperone for outer membrane proteins